MAHGDNPYDYLPPGFRPVLDEALAKVPQARRHLDLEEVPEARRVLTKAGFSDVASTLDMYMPHKYSS